MCAFRFHFFGARKSIEIRLRVCGPPLFQLYMLVAQLNAVVIFCLLHGSLLFLRFCGLIFGPPEGSKNGIIVLLLSCACGPKNGTTRRSHFWDRV